MSVLSAVRPLMIGGVLTLTGLLCAAPSPQAGEPRSQLNARSTDAVTTTRPRDGGPQSEAVAAMEQRLLHLINEIRISHALKPLEPMDGLHRIARGFSFRMNRFGFFGHYDLAGNGVADRLQDAEIKYAAAAENIAKNINFSDPVATAVDGWMNSDGHRANILTSIFSKTGVGIWKDGEVYHFTQVFMDPW